MGEMIESDAVFEQEDFDFSDMEEELRVDERCRTLLNCFYKQLLTQGCCESSASELAFCADYYVRDYLLDHARQNIVRPRPGIVRFFAGNWFITKTLDPEIGVLEKHLEAVTAFYRFLHGRHFISAAELEFLLEEAGQTAYYRQRIASFLDIHGDGYADWNSACTLEESE